MKISNSKKQLAKIISENGGWREGAKFAAQDQDGEVFFYVAKPTRFDRLWRHQGVLGGDWINCRVAQPNWHQTILSRDEYFHLYPAQDDDGWIEWNGGECPVEEGVLVDIKLRDGEVAGKLPANKLVKGRNPDASCAFWVHGGGSADIIAYRLHKPENNNLTQVGDTDVVESKPTIEQLAADYRDLKDFADRKQQEADEAQAEADSALDRLYQAGLEIGLDIAIASDDSEPEHELVITDWLDLLVGDEVECTEYDEAHRFGRIEAIDAESQSQRIFVRHDNGSSSWPTKWRFISRP